MTRTADVVICGAGIAGIAAAHSLSVQHRLSRVVLVDERAPLSLTSDKSTEAYRNWWPGPDDAMIAFMNRSIDLLEQQADATGNRFLMNRRGYLYTTASAARAEQFERDGRLAEAQGAGPLRVYRSRTDATQYLPSSHTGFAGHPTGGDLLLDHDAIRECFPWLADDIVAVLHARRCGWFSGQQLGMGLLDAARASGVDVVDGRVDAVDARGGVKTVTVAGADGVSTVISTNVFVNCAGPYARDVARMTGTDVPLFSELHFKIAFEDHHGVVDRNTGLVILDDPQALEWADEERHELAAGDDTRWMTETMPPGIHLRPEGYHGAKTVLMLWDYHGAHRYDDAVFPLPEDPFYPEIVIRGMTKLAPGLQRYADRLPHCHVDGGYYTKTIENRPLIGPLPVAGAFINAAFSGYGLMAAPAAGELLAAHVTGSSLPRYAGAFLPSRYESDEYRARIADWGSSGQL